MDEMYRMLGREHEADLYREAVKLRRAALARRRPGIWWPGGGRVVAAVLTALRLQGPQRSRQANAATARHPSV